MLKILRSFCKRRRKYPCQATWDNKDFSKTVTVLGEFGNFNGEFYYQVKDGNGVTGLPKSQLKF